MRKTTRGRRVQHVAPRNEREVTRRKAGLFGVVTTSTYTIKAHGGKVLFHKPPVRQMECGYNAAYVNWKECEGARRRGWS